MNFKSRGIRLNDFYLHILVIGIDDINIWLRIYEKESITIQSKDLY